MKELYTQYRFKALNKYGFKAIVVLILIASIFLPTNAFASSKSEIAPITDPTIEPNAYILVDATSGAIIKSKNEHAALPVASVSKIITALGAINTIEISKPILVSQEAQEAQANKIGMTVGQTWKRDDLLNSLMLISANDAAYALAIASAGSIEEFTKVQKRIAKNLGMKDSTFGDPSGLDDALAINGSTTMSAYDVAIAARAALNNPGLAQIVSRMNYQFTGGDGLVHTLTNHNDTLLSGYEGSNGIKTGYTEKSGRTLAASATRDGKTVIAVVIDVEETDQWAAKLMDDGFAYLADAQKNKTDLSKAKNILPEIGPISTEADLTVLLEPKKSQIKKASADKSEINAFSNYLSITNISIFIVLLFALIIYLRIRSVKKRRLIRKQERQRLRELQRRKMIDVIDLTNEAESELISKK